jgi:hypothetical protein
MIKRLSISLALMGLATFALGAAAFAWFSDSGSGHVSISSGTVDLKFQVDIDCNGGPMGGWDTPLKNFTTPFEANTWQNIVPGDTTSDCIRVVNTGPNGDLDVFVKHGGFSSSGAALRNATLWRYNAVGTGGYDCPFAPPNDAQYTTDQGCYLKTIGPGEEFELEIAVDFPETNSNQNNLQGLSFDFMTTLTGYTG